MPGIREIINGTDIRIRVEVCDYCLKEEHDTAYEDGHADGQNNVKKED